jgi:hypothetical protein
VIPVAVAALAVLYAVEIVAGMVTKVAMYAARSLACVAVIALLLPIRWPVVVTYETILPEFAAFSVEG